MITLQLQMIIKCTTDTMKVIRGFDLTSSKTKVFKRFVQFVRDHCPLVIKTSKASFINSIRFSPQVDTNQVSFCTFVSTSSCSCLQQAGAPLQWSAGRWATPLTDNPLLIKDSWDNKGHTQSSGYKKTIIKTADREARTQINTVHPNIRWMIPKQQQAHLKEDNPQRKELSWLIDRKYVLWLQFY